MRRDSARLPDAVFGEHSVIDGKVGRLADLADEDHRSPARWLIKRASATPSSRHAPCTSCTLDPPMPQSRDSQLRSSLKDGFASRTPGRPAASFIYRYVPRGGFLDGRAGLLFCLLHSSFRVLGEEFEDSGRVARTRVTTCPGDPRGA
jgi:hypothetical protein